MGLIVSIIICILLVIVVKRKHLLTDKAIITSIVCASIIIYCSSFKGFILLFSMFVLLVIADKISKKIRKEKDEITDKTGARDSYQIVANIGIATLMILLFQLTERETFLIGYVVSLSSALADSFASDLGVLTKGKVFNVLDFKESKKGLSGNISILGLSCSLLAGILMGIIFGLCYSFNIFLIAYIAILGFLGSYLDSLLGVLFQVKYKCDKCNIITEKKNHCNKVTKYFSGTKWFDNDVVNFVSNLIVTIISLIIWK